MDNVINDQFDEFFRQSIKFQKIADELERSLKDTGTHSAVGSPQKQPREHAPTAKKH
jgi:hypothetical protein